MIWKLFILCGAIGSTAVSSPMWTPLAMQPPGTSGAPPASVVLTNQIPAQSRPESKPQQVQQILMVPATGAVQQGGAGSLINIPPQPPVPLGQGSGATGSTAGGAVERNVPILPPPQPRPRQTAPRKEPEPAPLVGVAPGRLLFAVDKNGRSSKPQTVAFWSEDPALAQFVMQAGAPWLKVVMKPSKKQAQRFEVAVQPEGLGPGTHSAAVLIAAGGKAVLTIPVTVEVVGRR